MDRHLAGIPLRKLRRCMAMVFVVGVVVLLMGCATHLRVHSDISKLPPGSLRLAQVMDNDVTRADIVEAKEIYDALIASGIKDSDIADNSVVLARIFCCGGKNETYNATMLFVPPGIKPSVGDLVEVRVGRDPEDGDAGLVNVVTRVVPKDGCWWDPKNDRLWVRILYCEWMPKDGWIKQEGISPAWHKPSTPGVPNE